MAEQTSWIKPGRVSSSERAPPPMLSLASYINTERPACATAIAAANPFGPEPITIASYCVIMYIATCQALYCLLLFFRCLCTVAIHSQDILRRVLASSPSRTVSRENHRHRPPWPYVACLYGLRG